MRPDLRACLTLTGPAVCSSYAFRKSVRPVSFANFSIFHLMSTGANVSWLNTSIAVAITPPATSRTQTAQRHPASCPMNPPAIGPATGPISGPRPQIAVAFPRCSTGNKSAITPAPRVIQPAPPIPAKNRQIISVSMFWASAHPICQTTKNQFAQLKTMRRP